MVAKAIFEKCNVARLGQISHWCAIKTDIPIL